MRHRVSTFPYASQERIDKMTEEQRREHFRDRARAEAEDAAALLHRPPPLIRCKFCGTEVIAKRRTKKFCGNKCRAKFSQREDRRRRNEAKKIREESARS